MVTRFRVRTATVVTRPKQRQTNSRGSCMLLARSTTVQCYALDIKIKI